MKAWDDTFRVQFKSIQSDEWGDSVVMETTDLDKAIEECQYWFDEGQYSRILNSEGETIFVDYHFVDDWELMY